MSSRFNQDSALEMQVAGLASLAGINQAAIAAAGPQVATDGEHLALTLAALYAQGVEVPDGALTAPSSGYTVNDRDIEIDIGGRVYWNTFRKGLDLTDVTRAVIVVRSDVTFDVSAVNFRAGVTSIVSGPLIRSGAYSFFDAVIPVGSSVDNITLDLRNNFASSQTPLILEKPRIFIMPAKETQSDYLKAVFLLASQITPAALSAPSNGHTVSANGEIVVSTGGRIYFNTYNRLDISGAKSVEIIIKSSGDLIIAGGELRNVSAVVGTFDLTHDGEFYYASLDDLAGADNIRLNLRNDGGASYEPITLDVRAFLKYGPSEVITSGGAIDPLITVKIEPKEIICYVPTTAQNIYYRHRLELLQTGVNTPFLRSNIWSWNETRLSAYNPVTGNFQDNGDRIVRVGENWLAVREVGKSDYMGGWHGDNELTAFHVLIDGVERPLVSSEFKGERVVFSQSSKLLEVDQAASIETMIANTSFALSYNHGNEMILENRLEAKRAFTMSQCYGAMLAIDRKDGGGVNGDVISKTARQFYPMLSHDVELAGHNTPDSNAVKTQFIGDKYFAEIENLDGWTPDSVAVIDDTASQNKIRMSITPPNYAVSIGEVFNQKTRYRFNYVGA